MWSLKIKKLIDLKTDHKLPEAGGLGVGEMGGGQKYKLPIIKSVLEM